MTTAPDLDPYLLPMPTPASPVVLPHLACAVHAHLNGRYCDPVWPLAPLTENPSARRPKIHWENWPSCFRDEMRLAAWNLVNGQLRPTFLLGRSSRMRGRLSAPEVHAVTERWKSLAAWLEERGIRRLADCTADVLHDYGQRARDAGHSRSHVMKTLAALSGYGRLTSSAPSLRASGDRLGRNWASTATCPPQTAAGGENTTEPLAEQTMGPLLIWAMRMVEDLSGDILAAWAERQRLISAARAAAGTPAGHAALEAYLRPLIDGNVPLPSTRRNGRAAFADQYVAGITGATSGQVDWFTKANRLTAAAADLSGRCPLDVPVTGSIAGKPWRAALDFNEAPSLMRHLGTAAFIVCAYLTGMRPGEILGLRTGCCPDPVPGPDGRTGRHLIRGLRVQDRHRRTRQPHLRRRRARRPVGRHNPGRQRHPRPGAHGPRTGTCSSTTTPTTWPAPAPAPAPCSRLRSGAGSSTSSPGRTARQPARACPARRSPPTRTAMSAPGASAGAWPGTSHAGPAG